MSADKYPSIFSRQMEAIVYIFRTAYVLVKTRPRKILKNGRQVTQLIHCGQFIFAAVLSLFKDFSLVECFSTKVSFL